MIICGFLAVLQDYVSESILKSKQDLVRRLDDLEMSVTGSHRVAEPLGMSSLL